MTNVLNGQAAETVDDYRRRAEVGDTDAMYNLGVLLEGRCERFEATKWYQRAAQAGDVDSMFNLGGVLEDLGRPAEARWWYRQAAEAGDPDAKKNLSLLEGRGDPGEHDRRGRAAHPSAWAGDSSAPPPWSSAGAGSASLAGRASEQAEGHRRAAQSKSSPAQPPQGPQEPTSQWGQPPLTPSEPKRPGRILRRVLIGWNVLAVIWLIAGIINVVVQSHSTVSNCSADFQQACQSAYNVGALVGVGVVVFFWVAGDVILGVLYLVRSRSERR
jgi:hypothetical protein